MNVIEKRFSGKLRELRPIVKKIPPARVKEIVNEVFCIEFIEPDPARPFLFIDAQNIRWNVRPENRAGTKNVYWIMYKTFAGQRVKVYLAPAGQLTLDILNEKAQAAIEKIK